MRYRLLLLLAAVCVGISTASAQCVYQVNFPPPGSADRFVPSGTCITGPNSEVKWTTAN
jgi:hypothetical protein